MRQAVSRWCVSVLLCAMAGLGWAGEQPVAGQDYRVLNPVQQTDSPGKIEVIEFFSYACPHCAQFNPQITQWAAQLPAGVVFKRVPVLFNRAPWGNLARLYYSLEAMGELGRLDQAVFAALHQEGENLANPAILNEWLVKKKLDVSRFNETFNSFGVRSKTNRGDQLSRDYAIDGVPALAVNGRFLINSELPHERQLQIADALIAQLRTPAKKAR